MILKYESTEDAFNKENSVAFSKYWNIVNINVTIGDPYWRLTGRRVPVILLVAATKADDEGETKYCLAHSPRPGPTAALDTAPALIHLPTSD